MTMTKEQIDALPGLVAEATPGPWFAGAPSHCNGWWVVSTDHEGLRCIDASGDGGFDEKNARLISLAPTLAATVIEQQAEIERLRGEFKRIVNTDGLSRDAEICRSIAKAALTPDRAATNALGNIAHAVREDGE